MQSCSHPCGFRICRVEVHCVKMETADVAQFSLSGARLWLLPPELQTKQNKGNHKGSKGVAGTGLVDAVTLDRGRLQAPCSAFWRSTKALCQREELRRFVLSAENAQCPYLWLSRWQQVPVPCGQSPDPPDSTGGLIAACLGCLCWRPLSPGMNPLLLQLNSSHWESAAAFLSGYSYPPDLWVSC